MNKNYVQENKGGVIEEEGPVEYDPDERDFRKELSSFQEAPWSGKHSKMVREVVPINILNDTLDALDQLQEKHNTLCKSYETQEEENLKRVEEDGNKYVTWIAELEVERDALNDKVKRLRANEQDILRDSIELKRQRDELENGSKFNREQVYYVEGLNRELKKERDAKYSLEEIKEVHAFLRREDYGEATWDEFKENLTKQKEGS